MLVTGDARGLPFRDACVEMVVTSPPYWGLRDYHHAQQIGHEPEPQQYVRAIVAVMREVWRVLKPTGTLWLNLGDSYSNSIKGQGGCSEKQCSNAESLYDVPLKVTPDLKPKNLMGIPWRVAFALQADGWYLRSDIIWAKPDPMPESITDRPTKAHEYVFLLAKSERYTYDAQAIAEPSVDRESKPRRPGSQPFTIADPMRAGTRVGLAKIPMGTQYLTRNRRSVWSIATVTSEKLGPGHFARFPERLVELCILVGSRLGGLVLDPFVGSGTVVRVAQRLGRRGVGVDLGYQALAKEHTAQRGLLHLAADARDCA